MRLKCKMGKLRGSLYIYLLNFGFHTFIYLALLFYHGTFLESISLEMIIVCHNKSIYTIYVHVEKGILGTTILKFYCVIPSLYNKQNRIAKHQFWQAPNFSSNGVHIGLTTASNFMSMQPTSLSLSAVLVNRTSTSYPPCK